MDAISLNLPMLLNAHSKLSLIQTHQGVITLEVLHQTFQDFSNFYYQKSLSQKEINSYISFLIDCAIINMISPGKFLLANDIIGSESIFVKRLQSNLSLKPFTPEFEELKTQIQKFLNQNSSQSNNSMFHSTPGSLTSSSSLSSFEVNNLNSKPISFSPLVSSSPDLSDTFPMNSLTDFPGPIMPPSVEFTNNSYVSNMQSQGYKQRFGPMNSSVPQTFRTFDNMNQFQNHSSQRMMPPTYPYPSNQQFQMPEIIDPIGKIMSVLRKSGMDINIPLATQDKVLAILFVVLKAKPISCMRDLIDISMFIKESNIISQIEHVSKTKIRGILALLKQSGMMITQVLEGGQYVRLVWADFVQSYYDLRSRHDIFLSQLLADNHVVVPIEIKSDIVWMFDEDVKFKRLEMIESLIQQLFSYVEKLDFKQTKNIGPMSHLATWNNVGNNSKKNNMSREDNFFLSSPSFPSSTNAYQITPPFPPSNHQYNNRQMNNNQYYKPANWLSSNR